jgi:hypothetical protein
MRFLALVVFLIILFTLQIYSQFNLFLNSPPEQQSRAGESVSLPN